MAALRRGATASPDSPVDLPAVGSAESSQAQRTTGRGANRPVDPEWRRRRKLLLWSAPVVLVLLLAAGYLVGLWAGSIIGVRHAADEGRHATALEHFQRTQRWEGYVQPWLTHYNTGTAHALNGEYVPATDELTRALELVPDAPPASEETPDLKDPWSAECLVRSNLAVSWELLGDETTDPEIAAEHYFTAHQSIEPCAPSAPEHEETSERQQQKEDDSREEAEGEGDGGDGDGDGQDEESTDEDDPNGQDEESGDEDDQGGQDEESGDEDESGQDEQNDDPQVEDLLDRNRDAERERQRQQEQEGGGSGSGQNW